MDHARGIELARVWNDIHGKKKVDIVQQLLDFDASYVGAGFPMYGSLYYARDLPGVRPDQIVRQQGIATAFAIGPTVDRVYFDDGRGEVEMDRGPCIVPVTQSAFTS